MIENQPLSNRSFLNNLFLSPAEPRLRAGWRLLFQTGMMIALGFCLSVVFLAALLALDPALLATMENLKPEYMLLSLIGETFFVTVSVFLARRFLDKRSIESLGLKLNIQTLFDILMGILVTFLQMALIYFLMFQLGWITFQGFAWQFDPINLVLKNTLLFIVIFILVAWNEELLSRGYHLQTIASGTNIFWGVMISSAVFGLLHLGNPGANWTSTLGIFFAGIFFAFGYLRTRQLWLPMGMHLGWNFFEGVGFGFPVSGLDIYPLTRIQIHGPDSWTGGKFGPEAGLIILPALLLGVLLIHLYARYRPASS